MQTRLTEPDRQRRELTTKKHASPHTECRRSASHLQWRPPLAPASQHNIQPTSRTLPERARGRTRTHTHTHTRKLTNIHSHTHNQTRTRRKSHTNTHLEHPCQSTLETPPRICYFEKGVIFFSSPIIYRRQYLGLSLYRHPFLYTLFSFRFTLIINNKVPGQFLRAKVGSTLAEDSTLRVNLNLDGSLSLQEHTLTHHTHKPLVY